MVGSGRGRPVEKKKNETLSISPLAGARRCPQGKGGELRCQTIFRRKALFNREGGVPCGKGKISKKKRGGDLKPFEKEKVPRQKKEGVGCLEESGRREKTAIILGFDPRKKEMPEKEGENEAVFTWGKIQPLGGEQLGTVLLKKEGHPSRALPTCSSQGLNLEKVSVLKGVKYRTHWHFSGGSYGGSPRLGGGKLVGKCSCFPEPKFDQGAAGTFQEERGIQQSCEGKPRGKRF